MQLLCLALFSYAKSDIEVLSQNRFKRWIRIAIMRCSLKHERPRMGQIQIWVIMTKIDIFGMIVIGRLGENVSFRTNITVICLLRALDIYRRNI